MVQIQYIDGEHTSEKSALGAGSSPRKAAGAGASQRLVAVLGASPPITRTPAEASQYAVNSMLVVGMSGVSESIIKRKENRKGP